MDGICSGYTITARLKQDRKINQLTNLKLKMWKGGKNGFPPRKNSGGCKDAIRYQVSGFQKLGKEV